MKQKKVLITGVTGLLGKALAESNEAHELVGTYLPKTLGAPLYDFPTETLDVRDRDKLLHVFNVSRPDVVIHTASMGSVDYCESHKEESWEINVKGTENVAHFCEEFGAKFIFISSNAVYSGDNPPYSESDHINPINFYGELKVKGEEITQKCNVSWAIIRPILMYGWHHPTGRPNPVTWQISMMEKEKKIKMVDDVLCNPLYSINCAEAIWSVIDREKNGTYNIAGMNSLSRYDFAIEVAEVFGFNKEDIEPVPSTYFKEIAPRPKDASYNVGKMEKDLGVRPLTSKEGLERMKKNRV